MKSRLFFRLRTWLIIFIFLSLNISVPTTPEVEQSTIPGVPATEMQMTTDALEEENSDLAFTCLLEVILEESFALYNLFPDGDWSSEETTVNPPVSFDIIMEDLFKVILYPPDIAKIPLANLLLPDRNYPELDDQPPELNGINQTT